MRKDEEVKEMFYWNIEHLKQMFRQADVTTTMKAGWVTIKFGDLCTVKGRGYRNAILALDDSLEKLACEGIVDCQSR